MPAAGLARDGVGGDDGALGGAGDRGSNCVAPVAESSGRNRDNMMSTSEITGDPPRGRTTIAKGGESARSEAGSLDIVILNDAAYIRGGADRIAFDSACGLAAAGHRVLLFTAIGPVMPALEGVANLKVI